MKVFDFRAMWQRCCDLNIQQKYLEFSRYYYFVQKNLKDRRFCLEIGSAGHGLTLAHCTLFERVVSVDIEASPNAAGIKSVFEQFTPVIGNSHSLETVERVRELGLNYDVIFIDGDHSYEGVKQDYELYKEFLAPGGIIAFHDIKDTVWHRSLNCYVADFWREITAGDEWNYQTFDFDFRIDGMESPLEAALPASACWGGIGLLYNNLGTLNA